MSGSVSLSDIALTELEKGIMTVSLVAFCAILVFTVIHMTEPKHLSQRARLLIIAAMFALMNLGVGLPLINAVNRAAHDKAETDEQPANDHVDYGIADFGFPEDNVEQRS